MKKSKKLNLEGVKNSFKLFAILLMVLACMAGCKKDNIPGLPGGGGGGGGGESKLSIPAWAQGNWGDLESSYVIYKITSNEIYIGGYAWSTSYISSSEVTFTLTQTNKDGLYEAKFKASGAVNGYHKISIKRGDGTYIEIASKDDDDNDDSFEPSDYEKVYKK
ncbi:MAG: hypothetical protein LBU83_05850 [Bacteroidales bacterium]|jgi:hypothetical protein|nr:hypothetical protein [Bacteroidales bacterium]